MQTGSEKRKSTSNAQSPKPNAQRSTSNAQWQTRCKSCEAKSYSTDMIPIDDSERRTGRKRAPDAESLRLAYAVAAGGVGGEALGRSRRFKDGNGSAHTFVQAARRSHGAAHQCRKISTDRGGRREHR